MPEAEGWPKREGARREPGRSPEREGAMPEAEGWPEREGAMREAGRWPEREGAMREAGRWPEREGAMPEAEAWPKREGARREPGRSPEGGWLGVEAGRLSERECERLLDREADEGGDKAKSELESKSTPSLAWSGGGDRTCKGAPQWEQKKASIGATALHFQQSLQCFSSNSSPESMSESTTRVIESVFSWAGFGATEDARTAA